MRLGRWSDILISFDRILFPRVISLLRSLNAYILSSNFYRSFFTVIDFIYLILRPTDQHFLSLFSGL